MRICSNGAAMDIGLSFARVQTKAHFFATVWQKSPGLFWFGGWLRKVLHRDEYLSDGASGFYLPVGISQIFERKGLGNVWLELSGF